MTAQPVRGWKACLGFTLSQSQTWTQSYLDQSESCSLNQSVPQLDPKGPQGSVSQRSCLFSFFLSHDGGHQLQLMFVFLFTNSIIIYLYRTNISTTKAEFVKQQTAKIFYSTLNTFFALSVLYVVCLKQDALVNEST